ncbi:hypothetical protein ACKKBG_A08815 [Auxenochlorella protothecoides x Auxenochlorella symbiontica]
MPFRWFLCCGPRKQPSASKRRKWRRRHTRDLNAAAASLNGMYPGVAPLHRISGARTPSVRSEDQDWHDAEEALSGSESMEVWSPDGNNHESPFSDSSSPGLLDRLSIMWELRKQKQPNLEELPSSPRSPRVTGSRPILIKSLTGNALNSQNLGTLPSAPLAVRWASVGGETFQVRGQDYMKSRVKEPSGPAIYRLLGADLFSFDQKIHNIAHHIDLPAPPRVSAAHSALPPEERLPLILIINLQLPSYVPPIFGRNHDGPGFSLVFYFALPDNWTPDQVPNRAALELFQRFVHDGVESDGCATRDRLKLIPHVANPEEWASAAPLSRYESKLLSSYADKPILSRPQHHFFSTSRYMEIDLDIHCYAYLARKALHGFLGRLGGLVIDAAFIVQGNAEDELPELVFGAGRLSGVRLDLAQPFRVVPQEELVLHRLSPNLTST